MFYFSYVSPCALDLESIYAESSSKRIIILSYLDEPEVIKKYFINFAKSKVGQNYSIVEVSKLGLEDSKFIKKNLTKAIEDVIHFKIYY